MDESLCFPPTTVDSADPAAYRHFAVDDDNGVLYFCDRNGYLNGELLCYASEVSEDGKGTHNWRRELIWHQIQGDHSGRKNFLLTNSSGNW